MKTIVGSEVEVGVSNLVIGLSEIVKSSKKNSSLGTHWIQSKKKVLGGTTSLSGSM